MSMFKKLILPQVSGGDGRRQRGQVVILYALFMPVLFLIISAMFDLGFFYINVTRMQDAADAAVIAGARALIDGDEQSLSDYSATMFVNDFDRDNFYQVSRDTTIGDEVARTYFEANMGQGNGSSEENLLGDFWSRNGIYFESELLGNMRDNFETLYYRIELEKEMPHTLLKSWLPTNIKVSTIVRITHYMKGYDLFEQMKNLEKKQTYLGLSDIFDSKLKLFSKLYDLRTAREKAIDMTEKRSVTPSEEVEFNSAENRRVETINFSRADFIKEAFDNLVTGTDYDYSKSASVTPGRPSRAPSNQQNFYQMHQIINIDTVYPVRDYSFYMRSYEALNNFAEEHPEYEDLSYSELARRIAKRPPDPLYIRIESEETIRQIIININVPNTDELTERPLIFFYDGPAGRETESLPVILNLNADFRGVLYAPNSPVIINGNGHEFGGFVIADSFARLQTDNLFDEYTAVKDDKGNVMLVDEFGEVQYDRIFSGTAYRNLRSYFNIDYTYFDSFNLVSFDERENLFTTAQAQEMHS